MMTPSRFEEIGRRCFGHRWKGLMARELKVDKRVVQRWSRGAMPIPDGVASEVMVLAFGEEHGSAA